MAQQIYSMKLEKLKEINKLLNDKIKSIETYIFVENITDITIISGVNKK